MHRILGTYYLQYTLKLRESPLCSFCNEHEETIDHPFWECDVTSNFSLDMKQKFLGNQFTFSKQDIFFGYKFLSRHPYNFLILHAKLYIFRKKLSLAAPKISEFYHKFKFSLQVEKYLQESKKRPSFSVQEYQDAFCNCHDLFK